MKKFLTVLLALSVVFTYTVGTAFAYTPSDEQTKIADAQEAMEKIVKDAIDEHINYTSTGKVVSIDTTLFPGGNVPATDTDLTFSAISAGAAKMVSDCKEKIAKAGSAATGAADSAFDTALTDAYKGVANSYRVVIRNLLDEKATDTTYVKAVYTKAIADAVAEANTLFAKYEPANYDKANAELIRTAKQTALTAIDRADTDTAAGLDAVLGAISDFEDAVEDLPTVEDGAKDLATAKEAAVKAITAGRDHIVQHQTSALNAILDSKTATATQKADAQVKLEMLDAAAAQLAEIYIAQVDAVVIDDDTTATKAVSDVNAIVNAAGQIFYNVDNFWDAVDQLGDIDYLVNYANSYATQKKNLYSEETGLALYNEKTIDKYLADVVADIQNLKITTPEAVRVALDATPTAAEEEATLKAYKAAAIKAITSDIGTEKYALANWSWDEARTDAVEAIQDDYTAKIKVAATKDDIDALVKEAKKAMDAYLNNTDATTVKTNVDRAMKTLDYYDALADYANGIAAKNPNAYAQATIDAVVDAAEELLETAVLDENNADILQAEIQKILKDNYGKALAVIDAIKTDAEIVADTTALIDAIKALPPTVTLENKAQYLDVQEQAAAFVATPGTDLAKVTNFGTFKTYMSKLVSLEKSAVEKAIRAIPYTVTVDSRDAIEAARAAMDAYDDAYDKYTNANTNGFKYGYTAAVNAATLETKEAALESAQMVDAAKKIAALPAVITLADKAAVEAARASYDLLSDESKEVFSKVLFEKLVAAEDTLIALDKDAAIAAVEGMKVVKAHSAAGKGYIKVMWSVVGDETRIDGFQVYKSTKAQSGYTFMGKTTKHYMTNKKGLKKGKRFYYKVRAYKVIDGVKYFSDWSNKANRIYK